MTRTSTLDSPTRCHPSEVGPGGRPSRGPFGPRAEPVTPVRLVGHAKIEGDAPTRDEDLLGRYRDQRNPEDFAEIFRRHSGELYRYLARYLGDPALAEDVLQDTFLRIHAKCGLYRDGCPARPWLYAIAIHRAVDTLRRSGRTPTLRLDPPPAESEAGSLVDLLTSPGAGPLEQLQKEERHGWVRGLVAELAEPLRQVLVLSYYQGLTYVEIGGQLGIPLGTVKSRLHNAIARLRTLAERAGKP